MSDLAIGGKIPIQVDAILATHSFIGFKVELFGVDKQTIKVEEDKLIIGKI